ncbi:MAG: thioesterase family protein [Ahrensia sp.]
MTLQSAPWETSPVLPIQPDWIDYNGHLNMAFYMVLFDQGSDAVFAQLGMGPDYAASRKLTTYTGEAHICYLREVHQTMPVVSRFRMLDCDEKRMHSFQELVHADEGWVAATCEMMTLHVDQAGPRVAPFPDDIAANLFAMAARHKDGDWPKQAGRTIGIKRKPAGSP